jgi:hypothetical protein
MKFGELHSAIKDAENTMQMADNAANKMAGLLCGRLRKVKPVFILRRLKRELQDFNACTGEWKS